MRGGVAAQGRLREQPEREGRGQREDGELGDRKQRCDGSTSLRVGIRGRDGSAGWARPGQGTQFRVSDAGRASGSVRSLPLA